MSSLVSILIPLYNAEKWIHATIQSALAQTWEKKEIIIVNDGSTDNSLKIVKKFESKNVTIISQTNKGACAARNLALAFAKGDYIQWLDADDLISPRKIEMQLKEALKDRQKEVLYSSAWGRFFYTPQRAKFNPTSLWQNLTPIDWLIESIGQGLWMNPSTWLVSRYLTELAGPWNEKLNKNQDGEYFCRVIALSKFIKFIKEAECYYRSGFRGSISWNRSTKTLDSWNLSKNLCVDYLLRLENSERTRSACISQLKRNISLFYPERNKKEILGLVDFNYQRIIRLGGEVTYPKESWKFFLCRKIFGWNITIIIRNMVWDTVIMVKREFDWLASKTFYRSGTSKK